MLSERFRGATGAAVLAVAGALGGLLTGCGSAGAPPNRAVLEHDVGGWQYRRYQEMRDAEVWVAGNPADVHVATYVRDAASLKDELADDDLVHAMVTRYLEPDGLDAATVTFAQRLARDGGYQVELTTEYGTRAIDIVGSDERWLLWPARGYVIKLGGQGRHGVPPALVEAYAARYPSTLKARALDGRPPDDATAGDGPPTQMLQPTVEPSAPIKSPAKKGT